MCRFLSQYIVPVALNSVCYSQVQCLMTDTKPLSEGLRNTLGVSKIPNFSGRARPLPLWANVHSSQYNYGHPSPHSNTEPPPPHFGKRSPPLIMLLGHSKSISCFSSSFNSRLHVFPLVPATCSTSTVQKYTVSVLGIVELVILTTIYRQKCCPPASILGLRGG